jgi:hypothetical protein
VTLAEYERAYTVSTKGSGGIKAKSSNPKRMRL